MSFRAIEVDFDVHRAIENERRGFDEHPNLALRRLLKLSNPDAAPAQYQDAPIGRPWEGDGVVLPHGTRVRFTYCGRRYEGEIADGFWVVDGANETSPSGAAGAVARTKAGNTTNLDGWKYWQVLRPQEQHWIALADLRRGQMPV